MWPRQTTAGHRAHGLDRPLALASEAVPSFELTSATKSWNSCVPTATSACPCQSANLLIMYGSVTAAGPATVTWNSTGGGNRCFAFAVPAIALASVVLDGLSWRSAPSLRTPAPATGTPEPARGPQPRTPAAGSPPVPQCRLPCFNAAPSPSSVPAPKTSESAARN